MPEARTLRDWRRDAPTIVLIAANLVPLYGVFALGWEVFPLMFLFWFENVVVGFYNAARMLSARPAEPFLWFGKLFLVAFFCVHYGMFTAVHGMLVIGLFGDGSPALSGGLPDPETVARIIGDYHLIWPVAALVLSHGISFAVNYIGRGEYLRAIPRDLMSRPYRRILILHLTILAGGALVTALDAPIVGLVMLVALKTIVDVRAHISAHAREQADPVD